MFVVDEVEQAIVFFSEMLPEIMATNLHKTMMWQIYKACKKCKELINDELFNTIENQ